MSTIEERYQKLTQAEHCLKRPGMYVGSTSRQLEDMWVFDNATKRMVKKTVEYTPAFLKIFDEVLTNATDHAARDSTVDKIKVDLDRELGQITVMNTGQGIPVVMHKDHNVYVPELIFGHMLSGSNYDDTQTRTGAGTNGLGSKLSALFSQRFHVETVDSERGLKFVQEYTDNMSKRSKPKITKTSVKSYTKITFIPDYARFHMKNLDDDAVGLLAKRVYDCIACTQPNVSIFFNGEKLKGKGLVDYIKYYFDEEKGVKVYAESSVGRIGNTELVWEYAVVPWEKFEQVSFVNGNSTYQGGRHVDHIMNQITAKLKTFLESKKKLKDVKTSMIKDRFFLFLRATVVNPSFSSQTKEYLTTQVRDFGCRIEVSDALISKLQKSQIVDEIIDMYKLREAHELSKKTDGNKKSRVIIPKLEDALWAGTYRSEQCTLVLTEGDSAKTFAMWGRTIIGAEKMGVFPLKGKCVSADTKIPLWNGDIKLAKEVEIGDVLIGDDGTPRNVLTRFIGTGKMYEVSQDRGESYKVNDEHILTVCMPEHKSIFWVDWNCSWQALYWDQSCKSVKRKSIKVPIEVECKECNLKMKNGSLAKHYKRIHPTIKYKPYNIDIDENIKNDTLERLKMFLNTIPDYNVFDIDIQDYLNLSKLSKRKLKGIRGQCVEWEYKPVELDPYVLGLWLGDGYQDGYGYACNGAVDTEIIDYLKDWGNDNDAVFKKVDSTKCSYSISSHNNRRMKGCAPLKKQLSRYGLVNEKHIPKDFLINSRQVRLQVLAGLIDTDGYVGQNGRVEISQGVHHKRLVDDIVFLCRSLGFYTCVTERTSYYTYKGQKHSQQAFRIMISGETNTIPTKLPRKKTRNMVQYNNFLTTGTLKVRQVYDEMYVGIGVDATHRFLINDFTVTHNCINVRDASVQQLLNNEEINNIKQILGLKQGKEYKDTKELRYGKLMILTDADHDGSHIKGLLINMFHYWWPSLLKMNFVQAMRTPIVKAIKGQRVLEFFSQRDYEIWKETGNTNGYQIKYYKGLGTSRKEDAKASFEKIDELRANFVYKDSNCDKAITLAFEKDKNVKPSKGSSSDGATDVKMTDQRKLWLKGYNKDAQVDYSNNTVTYQDFIHKELIHFSIYDNTRSIPSLCDGMKPSQRKILHYMLDKNIVNKSIKVAQLSGYVSAETSYHHGEASLQQAIIGMAQNFVGSNNINVLYPDGNLGSRFQGGKDAASPRYVFTRLANITPLIYKKSDAPLLEYLDDDGQQIEPAWFIPVLPMILVNGCEGIGTGFSTYIPPHNPEEIIDNLIRVMDGKDPNEMKPYFRGFQGDIVEVEKGSYQSRGHWTRVNDTQIRVTELPVGMWVTPYKEYLESHIDTGKKEQSKGKASFVLKDVQNLTTDENSGINFLLEFKSKSDLDTFVSNPNVEKELKLLKCFNTNNMYLFDDNLIPMRYKTVNDILLDFYDIRLEFYEKRKQYLISKLQEELDILQSKVRFILGVLDGSIELRNTPKAQVIEKLEQMKLKKVEGNYDYLVKMPLLSLTKERVTELKNEETSKRQELETIKKTTEKEMWKNDLEQVKKAL